VRYECIIVYRRQLYAFCLLFIAFFIFFYSLSPLTTWSIRYLCGRLFFLFFLMWCGGAPGYFPRPPTPTLSSPFSFFWTTQHEYNNTQHLWEAHPAWDSNPADLAVVSEEYRTSFHHPTVAPDRDTHTSMPRRRFLPSKTSSPFGGIRTHLGALSATAMRPPSYLFLLTLKQVHNLKNRVFPHIISDYMENPRPTLFVNSLENCTI
jgi:hypothetical protein